MSDVQDEHMTIMEFLEARLTEDEAIASASGDVAADWLYIGEGDPVFPAGEGIVRLISRREEVLHEGTAHENVYVTFDRYVTCDCVSSEEGAHITRHDPARILREIAAKRAIIAASKDTYCGPPWDDADIDSGEADAWNGRQTAYREVLANLAAVYSSHPDYQKEWAL